MPEDKDFKRLVRARMDATGERYTTVRARLRPDAAAQPTPDEPPAIDGAVPMGLAELQEWRRTRPRPVPGARSSTVGSRWELWVNAGGRLAVLKPPALGVGAVAALGRAAGGVGTIQFGLHLELPAPEGGKSGEPFWLPDREAFGSLRRVHEELLGHLGLPGHSGLEGMQVGGARREAERLVLPARSGSTLLVGAAAGGGTVAVPAWRGDASEAVDAAVLGRLDLSAWPQLPGEPWAAYGVVLQLERDFPVEQTDPSWHVVHLRELWDLWDQAGQLLQWAADRVGLPSWPLHSVWLRDAASGSAAGWSWHHGGPVPRGP